MAISTVKNVSINHGSETLNKTQLESAANTVNMSVSTLIAAHAHLRGKKIDYRTKQSAKFFLKTGDDGLSGPERWALMAIFTNTMNGLSANRRINVKTMDGAYGSVAYEPISPSQAVSKRKAGKTVARRFDNDTLIARSDINIATSTLDKSTTLRVVTLIHEASHRYANTRDFGNKGYTNEEGTRFYSEGLTRSEAIINADSVAWMAVKIATPFCPWLDPITSTLREAMSKRRAGMGYPD